MQTICMNGQCLNVLLLASGFEWVEDLSQFNKDFINYNEDSNKGYFLEVDVEYQKNFLMFNGDFPFLPEKNKIKKCNQLVCSTHDKEKYIVHKRALKQALNHRLIQKST